MTISVSDQAFRADPYPIYEQLRRDGASVVRLAEGPWAIFEHHLCAGLLEDRRFAHWHLPRGAAETAHGQLLERWLTLLDPANHSLLRQLTTRLLSAARVRQLEMDLRHTAATLLPRASGRFDVVADLARPLTLKAAAILLGIPDGERSRFDALVTTAGARLLNAVSSTAAEGDQALAEIREFMLDLIERSRGRDETDRDLPGCLHAATAHDGLTSDDLVAFTIFFLFASHENLMNFIGNAFLALLRRPEVLLEFSRQRQPAAIDELLRFDSPVQFISLLARERVDVAGTTIEPDDLVWISVGAANRDPHRFEEADRLILDRPDNPHLSFGRGSLFCPGAMLARLEGTIALEALASLVNPRLEASTLCWRQHPIVLRGLHALPVAHEGAGVQ